MNTLSFPITKIEFIRHRSSRSRSINPSTYKKFRQVGQDIDFCGKWKNGEFKDQEYITIERTLNNTPYEWSMYTKNEIVLNQRKQEKPNATKALITGFNVFSKFPGKTFGDFNGDALLIEYTPDCENYTIWIFSGMKTYARNLWENWVAGILDLTIKNKVFPVSSITSDFQPQILSQSVPNEVPA